MEASDTVMNTPQIEDVVWVEGNQALDFEALENVAIKQAELSFKLGILEAMWFIDGEPWEDIDSEFSKLHIYRNKWQAQIKKWGIVEQPK